MNNASTVNIGDDFEALVHRIVRSAGLDIRIDFVGGQRGENGSADAIVRYGQDEQIKAVIQSKAYANPVTAYKVAHHASRLAGTPLLFVVGETTSKAREILRENNVAFVDGHGNVDVELPGLVYRITGTKKPPVVRTPARLSGKSGLVAITLLTDPTRDWHINELSATTGVSQGLVHRVVARLHDEGVLATTGDGPKRTRNVSDPTALLDLWVEEQQDKTVRTAGYQLAQTHDQLLSTLTGALADVEIDYAVTGAAAAAVVAPLATVVAITEVWVDNLADPHRLLAETPVEAVDTGANVVFLQASDNSPLLHRQHASDMWLANNYRLYFDLLADPRRGREQAEHLRQEVIGF